jgi:hypothetical protein
MVRCGSAYGKKPKEKKKEEKIVPENGYCIDCAKAYLMRREMPCNPIVAECMVNHERQVAEVNLCRIKAFEPLSGDTVIHKMIKAT